MSGQPNRNPLDQAKFRQQYLANLALIIDLQNRNFNANNIYKKTGIPQQPLDTRTQDEKFTDIQNLKLQSTNFLKELMDGRNAQSVINNLSNEEIIYLVSAFPNISTILKPKYSLGVPSEIFIDFLRRYIQSEERNRGIEEGLQQSIGEEILMNTQLIIQGMSNSNDFTQLENKINSLENGSIGLRQAVLQKIGELKTNLPTKDELKEINNIQNAILKEEIQQILTNALRNIPSKSELAVATSQLDTGVRTKDIDSINYGLSNLNQLLAVSHDLREELQTIKQLTSESLSETRNVGQREVIGDIFISQIELQKKTKNEIIQYYRKLFEIPEIEAIMLQFGKKTNWTRGNKKTLLELYTNIEEDVRRLTTNPNQLIQEMMKSPRALSEFDTKAENVIIGKGIIKTFGRPKTRNYEGSTRPKRSDRITFEDVDWTKGLQVIPRFIPFGKYIINKKRLDDNIVSLKTRSGGFLSNFKSQKVSEKLGKVFRNIIGGNILKYEDINELTDDEKEYLHKIAKSSDIIDRINIPSPSKTEQEKEINKFEIMKGQIMSGNDNIELIKKFKILLIKLSNKKLIPSREGKDLLFELTSMGY